MYDSESIPCTTYGFLSPPGVNHGHIIPEHSKVWPKIKLTKTPKPKHNKNVAIVHVVSDVVKLEFAIGGNVTWFRVQHFKVDEVHKESQIFIME